MARALSQTASLALARRLGPQAGWALGRRHSHTRRRAEGVALEAEAAGAGPSAPADSAAAAAAAQRLEEAIDGAMARMCEPDWAPFRPGTSYYAPPRPAGAALGLLAFLHRGGGVGPAGAGARVLSADEARAVASASRGYPCSTYFIDGHFPDEMNNSSLEADPA
ncbi:hypothetical protein ACP4OV_013456 [Aristida adscensionis]